MHDDEFVLVDDDARPRFAVVRRQASDALSALKVLGVEAEIAGSVAWGTFWRHSDIDFLIIDERGASDGAIYVPHRG